MISPLVFLLLVCAVSLGAAVVAGGTRARRAARLQRLARGWQMRFSAGDRFHLSAHVARLLPVPGAADVVVRDVAYAQDAGAYRYLFTVEYTVGVLRGKHREVAAATVTEARDCATGQPYSAVTLADAAAPLEDQYVALHDRYSPAASTSTPPAPTAPSPAAA
ncbi:MAG TPA: hypothetical protein VK986_01870 [Tepidisphaeraceae bacterium]|nr:hypothetical protein [Tepidisphaeraceae bacterium]